VSGAAVASGAPANRHVALALPQRGPHIAAAVQRLPFVVRWARGARDLANVAALRARCYGRHVPAMHARLIEPERQDLQTDARLLLAEDRRSGQAIGTLRIEHNCGRALTVEASVGLPPALRGAHVVEAARLCIERGSPVQVRLALFKALYCHCQAERVDWIVVAARHPLTRMYKALMFDDLLPQTDDIPMRHAAGLPHRLLGLNVATAPADWHAAAHPLDGFMVQTLHPDIHVGGGIGEPLEVRRPAVPMPGSPVALAARRPIRGVPSSAGLP
jgi:hypothetical protein